MQLQDVVLACTDLRRKVEQALFSEPQFSKQIAELIGSLGIFGLAIRIAVNRPSGEVLAEYKAPYFKESEVFEQSNHDLGAVKAVIAASHARETQGFDAEANREVYRQLSTPLASIIGVHWGSRNTLTLLPHLQDPKQKQRLEASVSAACIDASAVVAVHLDLDHFKRVNSAVGEEGGDRVLSEFGNRLRSLVKGGGLAVRKGGEEFSVFFPRQTLREVLPTLESFRRQMESTPFGGIDRPNTCSIGIVALSAGTRPKQTPATGWVDYLLQIAMSAEVQAKADGRNCIRLAIPQSGAAESSEALKIRKTNLTEATLWARQHLLRRSGPNFGNELEEYVAIALADLFAVSGRGAFQQVIEEFVRAHGIRLEAGKSCLSYQRGPITPAIHPVKFASLVIHALLRNAINGKGPLKGKDRIYLQVKERDQSGKQVLSIRLEHPSDPTITVPICSLEDEHEAAAVYAGRAWFDREAKEADQNGKWVPKFREETSLSPFLFVAIGAGSLASGYQTWAAGVVSIDDRPVTGGGLPDFWQSNLSRIVHGVLNNPNIRRLLVVGDPQNAQQTIQYLNEIKTWVEWRIGRRLAIDVEDLEVFKARDLAVYFTSENNEAVLDKIAEIFFSAEEGLEAKGEAIDLRAKHTRERRLVAPPLPMGVVTVSNDALRCDTLAEAYPRGIQMIREAQSLAHSDYMGRKFREIQSFKIVLDKPLQDMVPEYWENERGKLDEYYDRVFKRGSGIFGRRLNSWGTTPGPQIDQIDLAVRTTSDVIQKGIASRRILLSIPQPVEDASTPLGLVCIHVLPRSEDGTWHLDFQWVWRTVEALVGFPFSAFASIRQSQAIYNKVRDVISPTSPMTVSIGRVSYLALSFHIFTDESESDIARRIVTDAYP